jgi:homoserine kinase
VHVTAPASSANLGPGFDCLGLALDLPFELVDEEPGDPGFLPAEPTHPAAVSFVVAGGDEGTPLWWRSPIPPGRGLGFSGAARVAGAYLAHRRSRDDEEWARAGAMRVAGMLEGHPDNAAASTFGGCTVAAGERVVEVVAPAGLLADLRVIVWSPARSTSTDASRKVLAPTVALEDAAFSIGRAALWVAALAAGDLGALRTASEDRVHQSGRLAARADSTAALAAALTSPQVLAAWLSGSGPTVAALVLRPEVDGAMVAFEAALSPTAAADGRVRTLAVDLRGVRSIEPAR